MEPVGSWVQANRGAKIRAVSKPQWAARMCSRGLSATDVRAYRDAKQLDLPVHAVSDLLGHGLAPMAQVAPGCPVRDAIGWLLANADLSPKLMVVDGDLTPVDGAAARAHAWFEAGFAFGDYAYSAAGLSIEEARTGIATGSVDLQAAYALAALRGVAAPAV